MIPARTRRDAPLTAIVLAAAALCWTLLFVRILWNDPHSFDFGSFYRSGQSWNSGIPAYQDARPNLNPPWLTAIVLSPLARLPVRAALALWLAVSGMAVWRSLVLINRELSLSRPQLLWVVVGLAFSYAWILGWWQGQIGWMLMYLVTRAWSAARHHRETIAGCWLALAIAIKPTLALAAIPLGWPTISVAAAASATITLVGVLLTGLQPWADWLGAGASVTWYSHSPNASILGVLMRLHGAGGRDFVALSALPTGFLVLWAVLSVTMLIVSTRQKGTDRLWASGLLASIAIGPLGWLYYLPLATGPIVGSVHRSSRLVTLALLLLAVELPVLPITGNTGFDFVVTASLGCAATIMLWAAVVGSRPRSGLP